MKRHNFQLEPPPVNVYNYFLKTYLKNKSKFSNNKKKLADASRLWSTLSAEERDEFRVRLEKCKQLYEENCARNLDKLEPFLKKRPKNVTLRLENVPHTDNFDKDRSTSSLNAHCEAGAVMLPHCSSSQEDCVTDQDVRLEEQVTRCPIEKPIPPPKDATELYVLMHEDIPDKEKCLEMWRGLSAVKKFRYRNAVRTLKNVFMEQYKTYLLSLPNEELAKHLEEQVNA